MKVKETTSTVTDLSAGGLVEKDVTTTAFAGEREGVQLTVQVRLSSGCSDNGLSKVAASFVRAFERGDQMDMFETVNDAKPVTR